MTAVAVSRSDGFVVDWISQDYYQGRTQLLPREEEGKAKISGKEFIFKYG